MSVQIVASLTRTPKPGDLGSIPPEVNVLEVRADLCGDLDPVELRQEFSGRLMYTLRSHKEGGSDRLEDEDRTQRILGCCRGYDLVDLEADRDLVPEILETIDSSRRVLSWHGRAA